jgi:hypothetical protein
LRPNQINRGAMTVKATGDVVAHVFACSCRFPERSGARPMEQPRPSWRHAGPGRHPLWPALQWLWDTGAASVISKSMAAQVCSSRTGSQRHGGDVDGQHQQDAHSCGTSQPWGEPVTVMLFHASLVLATGHLLPPPDGIAQGNVSAASYPVLPAPRPETGTVDWNAPLGVDSDHAAGLTVCRAC